MSVVLYNGNVAEAISLNQVPSVSLTGDSTAEGVINSVTATLTFSTNAYGNTYPVTAVLYYDGGTVSATESIKMDSSNYKGGQFDFVFPSLTVDQANSISALSVSCSSNASKIFLKDAQLVSVYYLEVGEMGAPTALSLTSENAAPGARVTLNWSDASEGENNPISGYEIYRATDFDGEYTLLGAVYHTAPLGSFVVIAPSQNGASYYYKVRTRGTWDGFDSGLSSKTARLTCSFNSVGAPTYVSLPVSNAAPGTELTLSWSGASDGDNNAIAGYKVYRSEVVDGEYTLLKTVAVTTPAGSTTVAAPLENNKTYYFKVATTGTLAGYDSDMSALYAAVTCTFSSTGAPTRVTVDGTSAAYTPPGGKVILAWSGASAGANNTIVGYTVYRDGGVYLDGISASTTSVEVPAPDTAGMFCSYAVATVGSYSNSVQSAACNVYAYTDPVAPTTLTVSNDAPAANARITLAWSGAESGAFNHIVGYRVYRATSELGAVTQVAQVSVADTHSSCYVTAPGRVDASYYYWVETVGSYSTSGRSAVYTSITTSTEAEDSTGDTTVVVPTPTGYQKRRIVFGDYDTAVNGWTLTGWDFAEPETQTNYVTVPGRPGGQMDYSTILTGGDPRYNNRELNAVFELSEWTRDVRNDVISEMVNQLHGVKMEIVLPDDPTRYVVGRLSVTTGYSDLAHASVTVQAICEPWRYSQQETQVTLMATEDENVIVLSNSGRRILVPDVIVGGTGAYAHITCGGHSWTLNEGSYRLPDLELRKGNTFLTYSGYGTITFRYREAIL